jgi:hypothetical protein
MLDIPIRVALEVIDLIICEAVPTIDEIELLCFKDLLPIGKALLKRIRGSRVHVEVGGIVVLKRWDDGGEVVLMARYLFDKSILERFPG